MFHAQIILKLVWHSYIDNCWSSANFLSSSKNLKAMGRSCYLVFARKKIEKARKGNFLNSAALCCIINIRTYFSYFIEHAKWYWFISAILIHRAFMLHKRNFPSMWYRFNNYLWLYQTSHVALMQHISYHNDYKDYTYYLLITWSH